jgi:hypothetical protein
VFAGSNPTKLGGQTVHRLSGPGPTAMFVPNKSIAVFSNLPDDQIGKVAGSSGTKSPLTGDMEMLAAKFNGNTIWCIVGPAAISDPNFQSGFRNSMAANPASQPLAQALSSARGFVLAVNLNGSNVDIRVGILCSDEGTAQQTQVELQKANEKSKSDMVSRAMMLAMPAWVKKLQSESESSAQFSTDGSLALMSMSVSMTTLKEAIDAMAGMFAATPGAVGSDGGASPLMIPKNRGR